MGKIYNNGIVLSAGFNYHAPYPLDDRLAVQSQRDLKAYVETGNAYVGMLVYVADEKTNYQYLGTTDGWQKLNAGVTTVETFNNLPPSADIGTIAYVIDKEMSYQYLGTEAGKGWQVLNAKYIERYVQNKLLTGKW